MSGNSKQYSDGLQVIKVSQEPGRRYELDEKALASVLLRPDVRNLPVVVVSVAGAYRGGKSFILDFFLRYLNASRQNQLSGEWLGQDEEKLEGFDWRGGCESNTKGIHLWSEPIIVTIEGTGEKVAVLLMDTQGTFDTETDMGDNSTIFALSTLLSSVQIYNLRANIQEDDLQHLQLFTEYGKLAHNGEGRTFQTLLFLVRDWMSAFQYPYGYTGGKTFLIKKLTPKPDQKEQLREVRDHIYSCFEDVQCFLMPHPGLNVANEDFKGRLLDIDERFKKSLLELIPTLFNPNNLKPKIINGDKVRAQELLEFFKQYVEIFNNNDLPQATTIFKATVDACMMLVLHEASECYDVKMNANVAEDESVLEDLLTGWHRSAVSAAVAHFEKKKKLGSQDHIEIHLAKLRNELQARLSLHLFKNNAKVRDTLSKAKKAYDRKISSVCKEQSSICLHAIDLRALHLEAVQAALSVFGSARTQVPHELDKDRKLLLQDLDQEYQRLRALNEKNHWAAKLESREIYMSRMNEIVNRCNISFDLLLNHHNEVFEMTMEHFKLLRNRPSTRSEDTDQAELQKELEICFERFQRENDHRNWSAKEAALHVYSNYMRSKCGPGCLHPRALEEYDNEARTRATSKFMKNRIDSEWDDCRDELAEELESYYMQLKTNNVYNNNQAVDLAYHKYMRHMDKHSKPRPSSVLIIPFIVKIYKVLPTQHDIAKEMAINTFKQKRLSSCYDELIDEYFSTLEQKIDEAFITYKSPFGALLRELGLQDMTGIDAD